MTAPHIKKLLEMLTYMRPHNSKAEAEFIAKYIEPLKHNRDVTSYETDEMGNVFVHTVDNPKTMFCAHVDTVHNQSGKQLVLHDSTLGIAYVDGVDTNCLGADDTAGIWLMIEMIKRGVPAAFAFFRGEEVGGLGSRHAAKVRPEYFQQFDRAVAFDRRGQTSVITYQAGGRCCSDVFAQALSQELNVWGNNFCFTPDSTGIYTDTANLVDLVGECTNVSVGYEGEHGKSETLDINYCDELLRTVTSFNWNKLPTVRMAGEYEPVSYGYESGWWDGKSNIGFQWPETEDVMNMTYKDMVQWVDKTSSEDVAEVIYDLIDQLLLARDDRLDYNYPAAEGWQ